MLELTICNDHLLRTSIPRNAAFKGAAGKSIFCSVDGHGDRIVLAGIPIKVYCIVSISNLIRQKKLTMKIELILMKKVTIRENDYDFKSEVTTL